MATTFEVYPGSVNIPSFREVLELANKQINIFLSSLGIHEDINLEIRLLRILDNTTVEFDIDESFSWGKDCYCWFTVSDIPGGTDAHQVSLDELRLSCWRDEIETNLNAKKMSTEVLNNLSMGYYWYFRRSAGQPGVIVLAYGLIAASLAILTKGFIYTDDGAWDYNRFPAKPEEFITWYFRPSLATTEEDKEWASRCIQHIKETLKK